MPKRSNSKPKRKTSLKILSRSKSNISEKSLEKSKNLEIHVKENEPIDKISIEINNNNPINDEKYDYNTIQTRRKKYKRIGFKLNSKELDDLNTIINSETKKNNNFIRHKRKRLCMNRIEKKNSSKSLGDEKELKDFVNKKKQFLNQNLLKYKNLYKEKKNNKIILLKEEDEENYFKNLLMKIKIVIILIIFK